MRSIDIDIDPTEDDDLLEEETTNRCGDVSREEVEDDLVVEEAREELTGLLWDDGVIDWG